MQFNYNDGGRSKYFTGSAGDCVTRAIAIATGRDYKEVYDTLNDMAKSESVKHHRGHKRSNSRNGVFKETWKRYLRDAGWVKVSTCKFGSSSDKIKFVDGALPEKGTYIVQLSKHLTVLIDGVINDTYDCSKKDYYDWESGDLVTNDERCVYGYWRAPNEEEKRMQDECAKEQEAYKAFVEKKQLELASKRLDVKLHNDKIKKAYAAKIRKAKALVRKLERERDKQLLEMPKMEKDAWAYECLKGE